MKKRIALMLLFIFILAGCNQKPRSQDQVLLDEAEDQINHQSYDNAREKLTKCLELNPQNVKAHVLLGDVYYFQSNLIMFRMQILNMVFKYGSKIRWATPKELDLATATEELLRLGMDNYQKALDLMKAGATDETVDQAYLYYELGWGYLAEEDIINGRESFKRAMANGQDRWGAKSALLYVGYLEEKQNKVKLDEMRLKEANERLEYRKKIKLKGKKR
jgi:Tfp pilus assembly protein PilF